MIDLLDGNHAGFAISYIHESDLAMKVWQGGMPEILRRNVLEQILRWREGYVTSYLERDLRHLSQIDNLAYFRRLKKTAALWSGQVMNESCRDSMNKQIF